MAEIRVYGHQGCPRCSRVQAFLAAHGIPVQPHYLQSDPLDQKVCARLLARGIDENMFDRDAMQRAGINVAEPDVEQTTNWLAQNPDALRAPLVIRGDHVLSGDDPQQIDCILY